ncbi:MAG: ATP-grasp domain-containing protein [Bacteroidia bacterium]|nr:ATP-grasp domain-containing protein [Bacteroidia bacterium]
MSKIVVLGVAGPQTDFIKLLKEKGHYVVGMSYRKEGVGLSFVDEFCEINITDKEAILKFVEDNDIDVVYSVGSDLAMPSVGYVNDRTGRGGFVTEEIALTMQDKSKFRKFLSENKIQTIKYRASKTINDLDEWDCFPAIVKPTDSQGQRGVNVANNREELKACFEEAYKHSKSQTVIVEQYIDGKEISVNGYMYEGELVYGFISDRRVVEGFSGGLVKGHDFPSKAGDSEKEEALALVKKVSVSIGYNNGPIYFQMKYKDGHAYIIEGTPRFDGCHIWRLIKQRYGVDLLSIATEHLLTGGVEKMPLFEEPIGQIDVLDFFLEKPNLPFAENEYDSGLKGNKYFEFYYKDGEVVRPVNGKADKVGYCLKQIIL